MVGLHYSISMAIGSIACKRSWPALNAVSNNKAFLRGMRGAGVTMEALAKCEWTARGSRSVDWETYSEVPQPGAGVPMMIHSETP